MSVGSPDQLIVIEGDGQTDECARKGTLVRAHRGSKHVSYTVRQDLNESLSDAFRPSSATYYSGTPSW